MRAHPRRGEIVVSPPARLHADRRRRADKLFTGYQQPLLFPAPVVASLWSSHKHGKQNFTVARRFGIRWQKVRGWKGSFFRLVLARQIKQRSRAFCVWSNLFRRKDVAKKNEELSSGLHINVWTGRSLWAMRRKSSQSLTSI